MLSMENNFGDWLLRELESRGMSQSDLSRLSGLSRGSLSNLISGARGLGIESVEAIARALKLPQEQVFRAAGILPPAPEKTEQIEAFDHLLSLLPEEDIEDLYALVKAKVERIEEKEKEKRAAAKKRLPAAAAKA